MSFNNRMSRRDARRAARDDRRAERLSTGRGANRRADRLDRQSSRQTARMANVNSRQQSRQVAFEQGVNPNPIVSHSLEAATALGTAYFENKPPPQPKDWSVDLGYNDSSNVFPYVLGGIGILGALYMMKK